MYANEAACLDQMLEDAECRGKTAKQLRVIKRRRGWIAILIVTLMAALLAVALVVSWLNGDSPEGFLVGILIALPGLFLWRLFCKYWGAWANTPLDPNWEKGRV